MSTDHSRQLTEAQALVGQLGQLLASLAASPQGLQPGDWITWKRQLGECLRGRWAGLSITADDRHLVIEQAGGNCVFSVEISARIHATDSWGPRPQPPGPNQEQWGPSRPT